MGILGKLLIVVNLLAGAAFAYLAVQDWKGRQTITAAGLRAVLLIQGLPLDSAAEVIPPRKTATSEGFSDYSSTEIPFRVEMAGGVPTETVSPEVLYVYFSGISPANPAATGLITNQPVPSQVAEVKRVYALVKKGVDAADGAKAKTALLAGWLELQPESYEARVELLKLIREDNADELAKRLYARFDRVLSPPSRGQPLPAAIATDSPDSRLNLTTALREGTVTDETAREAELAHLLVHLDREAGWQKRVMMVVGLRRYVRAVGEQVLRFEDMADRVAHEILDDQDGFATEYHQLLQTARSRTIQAHDFAEIKQQLDEQKKRETEAVAIRTTQLESLKLDLLKAKAEVDALLDRQTRIETELFAVQREVSLMLEDIYRLEAELARRERERYGKK